MKIYIEGYYGYANLGDDYILLSLLKTIYNSQGKEAEIFVGYGGVSKHVEIIYESYVDLGVPFHKIVAEGNRWKKLSAFFHFMLSCDCWIIGGGGLFPRENTMGLLILFVRMLLARIACVKICFYGIEINPVERKINRCLWRLVGGLADFFVTRNEATAEFLKGTGIERVKGSSDITFSLALEDEYSSGLLLPDEYDIWGLGMPWTEEEMKKIHYKERYRLLCSQLARMLENVDAAVLILPFFGLDRGFVSDVTDRCRNRERIIVIEDEIPFYKKRGLFLHARKCLCMRFHSLIFALYAKKPFVCISYSPKSSMLLNECGLEDCYVEFGVRDTEFFYREFDLNIEMVENKYWSVREEPPMTIQAVSEKLIKKAKAGERILKKWMVESN